MSSKGRIAPALLVALTALAGVSCTGEVTESDLDPFLCTLDDLGGGYQQLITGDFSPGDLADLGPRAEERERELTAAGMVGGRFSFWKQSLPKPPFDPPLNVVCQVLEFETEGQAAAWVAGLEADAPVVATSAIAWLPGDGRSAVELGTAAAEPGSARAFEVTAGSGPMRTRVYFAFRGRGRYVGLVAAGGQENGAPEAGRELTERVAESMETRLEGAPQAR